MLHALLLLQLLAVPTPAQQQAEELVHASIRDYDLGYFDRALGEAEQAYRLDPLPQILFNVGQCHRALKHWDKAAFFYDRYLTRVPGAPNRTLVEQLLAEVKGHVQADEVLARLHRPEPPAPVVVVSPTPAPTTPPPAAPIVTPERVPPAAVEPAVEKPVEPQRSHATAYVLGSIAVVSLAFMVVGIVEVESFEAVVGRLNNPVSYPAWQQDEATATSQLTQAQVWEAVAFTTGALALGTGTAAVLTW